MKVGIIGTGHIGGTFAALLVNAGHEVALANSRGPETLRELVSALGPRARATTVEGAAEFGEVVVVSVPLKAQLALPSAPFAGKVVVDTGNYYPARDGNIEALDNGETTSSELFARHLQGARVVKSLNTIWYEHLRTEGDTKKPVDARRAIFVAGDDIGAKAIVGKLIEDVGFGAVDAGTLAQSARLQPNAPVYNKQVTAAEARAMLA